MFKLKPETTAEYAYNGQNCSTQQSSVKQCDGSKQQLQADEG